MAGIEIRDKDGNLIDVQTLMDRLGLNTAALGVKLGVSERTIIRWIKGQARIHQVNRRQLERLARKIKNETHD